MTRTTIDFGIDLGTTNSSIAVYNEGKVEVFRNNEGFEYTPSAVWLDRHNSLIVGRTAYEHREDDPDNAFGEFKRLMGTNAKMTFARSGRSMSPEELSAEVLKSLKEDVRQRAAEEVKSAIITVPADFNLTQTAATNRAAQLAGLANTVLLQEPVAAALAYGFQSQSDKVFWLTYDFGGGTFDAAIIQVRDGAIEVINHGGDNELGGKDIDWSIVDNLLVPALTKDRKLDDFKRGNARWRAAFAKLKWHAENAKIALSRRNSIDIDINFTVEDGFPEPFRFEYPLLQTEVAKLADPFILKTIDICKNTMSDKRLGSGDIEKLVLVGGPTLAPYLRERLVEEITGLGIPLEARVDPMTVVAQGAAIFAGTQRMKAEGPAESPEEGDFLITFPDWKFTGSDVEPMVAGIVTAAQGQNLDGLSVEIFNQTAKPAWRSGKLPLTNGSFMTSLWAEKKEANTFQVTLFDKTGNPQKTLTDPKSLTYTIGLTFTEPPLTHTLGVALINNEFLPILEKGTPLPGHRGNVILHTTVEVRKGENTGLIRIPVMEGENPRADRNRRISALEINPQQIKRDVPVGSEVEVTFDIDRSRLLTTRAYIPVLDEEFENVITMQPDEKFDPIAFSKEFEKEKQRLAELAKKAQAIQEERANEVLHKIDQEQMVQQVESAQAAASVDADDARKCQNRLLDLRITIDQVEDALEWPGLLMDAEKVIAAGKEIIQRHANTDQRRIAQAEEAQLRIAMQTHDPELLAQRIESYRIVLRRILRSKGILQVIYFQDLSKLKSEMRDQKLAEQLISDGLRAMNANDPERLDAINRQLVELLPSPPPPPDDPTVAR